MDFGMCSGVGYGSNAPGILRGDCSVGLHLYAAVAAAAAAYSDILPLS